MDHGSHGKAHTDAIKRRKQRQNDQTKAAGYMKKMKRKGGASGSSGTDKSPYKPKSMR